MALAEGDVLLRSKARYRVVRIVSERGSNDLPPSHLAVIRLHDPKANLELWPLAKTYKELADGHTVSVTETAPFITTAGLSEAEKETIDRRWQLIERIKACGARIFERKYRGQLAKKLAADKIASKPFFYHTIRLWFQSGAAGRGVLRPDFSQCGAPAKDRIPEEGGERAGGKRKVASGKGLVITKQHRWHIERALTHAPIGLHGRTPKHAYYWMLIKYYREHVRIVPLKEGESPALDNNGEPLPQRCRVVDPDKVPSLKTFLYHYRKKFSPSTRARQRMTARAFDALYKPTPTGTLCEVDGIGSRYYTDATTLDEYVVSRFDRNRIIGRPTLYLVVDQFSRLIVGMYLGLEAPSWVGAMLALYNCSVDKVAYCKTYDIDIAPHQWPTGGFPQHLMADRGGDHIAEINDRLTEGFGITLDTAAPYLGAAKGVGERAFQTVQANFGPYIPGYIDPKFMGRGEKDPALKAVLNITEVTRTIIRQILDANVRTISGYEASPEQIRARVPSQPVALWQWCEANHRVNHIRKDLNYLKQFLWPKVTLKTARKLLQFCTGLYFQGERVVNQDWLYEALKAKTEFDARYHPLDLSYMMVFQPDGKGTFDAQPVARSRRHAVYGHCELRALRRQSAINDADADEATLAERVAHRAENMKTVKTAKKDARQQAEADPQSDAARKRDRQTNKAREQAAMAAESLELNVNPTAAPDVGPNLPPHSSTDDDLRELIRQRKSGSSQEQTRG